MTQVIRSAYTKKIKTLMPIKDQVNFSSFYERYHQSSTTSQDIMIHCEIEKIWIIFDASSGLLEILEL